MKFTSLSDLYPEVITIREMHLIGHHDLPSKHFCRVQAYHAFYDQSVVDYFISLGIKQDEHVLTMNSLAVNTAFIPASDAMFALCLLRANWVKGRRMIDEKSLYISNSLC